LGYQLYIDLMEFTACTVPALHSPRPGFYKYFARECLLAGLLGRAVARSLQAAAFSLVLPFDKPLERLDAYISQCYGVPSTTPATFVSFWAYLLLQTQALALRTRLSLALSVTAAVALHTGVQALQGGLISSSPATDHVIEFVVCGGAERASSNRRLA